MSAPEKPLDYRDPKTKLENHYWCAGCQAWRPNGGPDHTPSAYCRSGKRPHCSCDACF